MCTRVGHTLQMMRARLLRGVLNVTQSAKCTRTVHTAQQLLVATNAVDSSVQPIAGTSKLDANAGGRLVCVRARTSAV